MKIIYDNVLQRLTEVAAIKWIDKDNGQLKYQRPEIAYPAALIKIELLKCEDRGGNGQDCTALVTIRLAFDFSGNTAAHTPDAARNQALSFYGVVDTVYAKFQGFETAELAGFSRRRSYEEDRDDGLSVMVMPFETAFTDLTAV